MVQASLWNIQGHVHPVIPKHTPIMISQTLTMFLFFLHNKILLNLKAISSPHQSLNRLRWCHVTVHRSVVRFQQSNPSKNM